MKLLFDPQTAGGMLISVAADKAEELLERLKEQYPSAGIVGRVADKSEYSVKVGLSY